MNNCIKECNEQWMKCKENCKNNELTQAILLIERGLNFIAEGQVQITRALAILVELNENENENENNERPNRPKHCKF